MEESDFYKVLGLRRNCSASDVRSAYKRLAMKWHPDKCSARSTAATSDQAKRRFQTIQEAYSVLSDKGQRFCYDAELYDQVEEEATEASYGMQDFMEEMTRLMSENTSKSNGAESLEELKELFRKMLDADNLMPSCKQKVDTSSSGQHLHFAEMPVSHDVSANFQTGGFAMGACSGSSGEPRQGKRRGSK